jgi:signal recognition particle subunit SEC65
MRVNVHLKSKAADLLLDGAVDSPLVGDVLRAVRDLGVKLLPVYPKSRNRRLKSEFVVEVPDRETADRVVDRLNALDATEAAYYKPADELP